MEEWRDIAGYEGMYQVSNLGRVRSLDRFVECSNSRRFYKGRILSAEMDDKGYIRVLLSVAGKRRSCMVHRLVATAFLDNSENLPEVNHKDENPANNALDNLEWCTKQYNLEYGTGRTRSIQSHKVSVLQYNMAGELIAEFGGVNEAAIAIGKPNDATAITKCCKGKNKTAHGFIWKYKEVT